MYGAWVKGVQYCDTLLFLRKNNRDILWVNMSFNPSMPAYTEQEYRYRKGKLEVKLFSPITEFLSYRQFYMDKAGQ